MELGDDGVQIQTLLCGDSEESPGQLESQLAWWRQQLEVLGQHGRSSCGSDASTGAADEGRAPNHEELHGCSEWLRLSLASGSGTAPAVQLDMTCNGVNEATEAPSTQLDGDEKAHMVEAESALSKDNADSADITLSTEPETVAKTTRAEDSCQEQDQGQADEPDQEPQSHLEEDSARALEHARAWAASLLAIEPQTLATSSMMEGAEVHVSASVPEGSNPPWTAFGQPIRYRYDRGTTVSWAESATPEPRLEVCGFEELFNL